MLRSVGGLDVVCEQDRKVEADANFDLSTGRNERVASSGIETEKSGFWSEEWVPTFERINHERPSAME